MNDADILLSYELKPGLESGSVGAKAANLGKVIEHGLDVPLGCVVTRHALTVFLEENRLLEVVQDYMADTTGLEQAERIKVYTNLCDQINGAPIPQAVVDAVTSLADALFTDASDGLAVRSSGIYEDGSKASFAGVYESYLSIRSVEDLWDAIRKCWCTSWTPHALEYAKRMGIDPEPDAMAVLIQQLVPADSAGVLFTAHPQTGNPWQFTLESTFGLAQELVGSAGATPADRFVFEWDTGKIIEKEIVEKPTMCVSGTSGVENVVLSDDQKKASSLSDEMAIRVAQLALDIDRLFACRVDIEWVVSGDKIYIVQVRPITALPEFFPHHLAPHMADRTWRATWPQWFYAFRPNDDGKITPPLYRDIPVVTKFDRYQVGSIKLQPERFMGVEVDFHNHRYIAEDDLWSRAFVDRKSDEEREAYLRENEPALRGPYLKAKHQLSQAILTQVQKFLDEADTVEKQIEALLWVRDTVFDSGSLTGSGPVQTLFMFCSGLLQRFLKAHLPEYDTEHLLQGHHSELEPYFPHVQIKEAEKLVEHIGEGTIRKAFEKMDVQTLYGYVLRECEASPFLDAYEIYCDRFGLIPPSRSRELIFGGGPEPNHAVVLMLIQNALQGKHSGIEKMHRQATQNRKVVEAEIRQALVKKGSDVLQRFEQLLDWALFWGPALNDRDWGRVTGSQCFKLWYAMCDALHLAGLVDDPKDICYFTVTDLVYIAQVGDVVEGRQICERRKYEYERDDRLKAPEILGKLPVESSGKKDGSQTNKKRAPVIPVESGTLIQGKGNVPGKNRGFVHKIASFDQADKVTDEQVLFFNKTMQLTSEYVTTLLSLMLRIRGLVVQLGPTWMHHIGQIARECGVPVVQISPEDMARIEEGVEVEVDGTKGTVTIQN